MEQGLTSRVKHIYCLWIKTGEEESYIKEMLPAINSPKTGLNGLLYFFKQQKKLKNGKEYSEPFFPSYVFFETNESDPIKLKKLSKGNGFISFLPNNKEISPLNPHDSEIIMSIITHGSIVPIVHATFDINDRIQILDGPFKDVTAKVIAVNRRNKRVNVDVEFLNGIRQFGLFYEEVKKVEDGEDGKENNE